MATVESTNLESTEVDQLEKEFGIPDDAILNEIDELYEQLGEFEVIEGGEDDIQIDDLEFSGENFDEEREESSEDVLSDEEPPEPLFKWYPSEPDFQESDLQSRQDRRYVLGVHSFLRLNDPNLETALIPETTLDDNLIIEAQKKRKKLSQERQDYKDLCEAAGIAPNPTFLASLGKSVLDLTNHGLADIEIEAICKILANDMHIDTCLLGGNRIGRVGGLAVAEMIKSNGVIEHLSLSNAEIIEALEEICEAVTQNTTLMRLNLSKNELIDQDMLLVGNMIAENESLKFLNLSYNDIRDEGLREIGLGLQSNSSLLSIDVSRNRIRGEKRALAFFVGCAKHASIETVDMKRNIMRGAAAQGCGRVLWNNKNLAFLDIGCNRLEAPSGATIGRSLRKGHKSLKELNVEQQSWNQFSAANILQPFGSKWNQFVTEIIDFGFMLDIHKSFIKAKDKALKIRPDLKIIHGLPYGLNHANGPDHKALVVRRANVVCETFETPLVMLMEELAKEPKILRTQKFKKFIKQCNLYKDKVMTQAFEKVFAAGKDEVNCAEIIKAFDKEYPGVRKIPEPKKEPEEEEEMEKKKKKGKGKGAKGKGKKGGGSKKGKKKK